MAPRKTTRRTWSSAILNCDPAPTDPRDWTITDAVDAGLTALSQTPPTRKDLRRSWWKVQNQKRTGACVGYATACGVLWWHFVDEGWISTTDIPSARFIWMANKETDDYTAFPTTFLEPEGTQTRRALGVARRYGCVLERDLPMSGALSPLSRAAFFTKAARLRIASFHNLGTDQAAWRRWLAFQGPILTRLNVDDVFMDADRTAGYLGTYNPAAQYGGHAVCIVGYTTRHFIVRNSWGTGWGDAGFAYASNEYAADAFTETFGAIA